MTDTLAFDIRDIDAPVGAEVIGLDLRRPLDAATRAALLDAWHARQVLVFRDQALEPEEQVAFTRQFGTPGQPRMPSRAAMDNVRALPPEVMLVSNIRVGGKPLGLPHDGEMWFHSDMCYVEIPHMATLLHAVELPSVGGETLFADMYAAYDRLRPALRERLEGARALHIHDYKRTDRPDPDADLGAVRNYAHPVFVTHPATGRKALYVNRLMTARIEGMAPDESEAVLEELFAVAEDPAIVYAHRWRPGDLVMWDNRCSIHARTDFPPHELRLMRRCTVEGGPMIAAA